MRIGKALYGVLWGLWVVCLLAGVPQRGMARDNAPALPLKPLVPDSVLERMFHSASIYSHEVKSYKADLYLKGHLTVHKQNRIIRYVPSMFRLEKGVKDYVHESISDLQYTAPGLIDRKVRAMSTTFPSYSGQIFDVIDYMKFNIYAPSLMGNKLLSPLNEKARVHYRYLLESVEPRLEGELYCIRVLPRYRSTQLVEGVLWLSSSDWTIRRMSLKGRYDLIRFHLDMQMGEEEDTKYLPVLMNLDLNFKFLKNHLEMKYTGWMRYSSVTYRKPGEEWIGKKTDDHNLSNSYTLTCDTSRLVVERDSFNRIRPIPLSSYEDSLYRMADERRRQREADTLKSPPTKFKKNMVFLGQIGDALISSYDIDLSRVGSINCSPIINPLLVSYSHRNGISYRQVFKYNKLFHDGRLLRIAPQIGYNFTKKELYAKADVEYFYNPRRLGSIEVHAGNGNRIYSSVVLDQLKEMPDSTFSFEGLELDYFKDVYVDVSHNIELCNGLKLGTGVAMHWRYTKSTPEVEARVRSRYNSFAPRIRLEWTPGMYYYMNGNRKINVGSYYPTFMLDYERGVRLLKNSGTYERIECSVEQVIRLKNVRSIAYHIGGGMFTNQSDMYFVDYVHFANLNLPQGWNDDIGGTFQMLDGRWYNASSHYLRGNMTFEAPFILLYPVSRLLSFIQKERIYAGILFMPHLNPYLEFGYGFATHLFDAGVFIGNEKGKFTSVGCKFTFELFNK